MDNLTHALTGALICDALPFTRRLGPKMTWVAAIVAAAPDLDMVPAIIANFPPATFSRHALFAGEWVRRFHRAESQYSGSAGGGRLGGGIQIYDIYRQRLEAAERLGDAYAFYDSELAEKESRLRTLRHDFRHLGVHLAMLAEERDFAGILREIRAVAGMTEETAVTVFCENRTVNAIVSFHFSRAAKMGVHCVAKAFVPEKLSLPDAELALLLGNALENAVKAARPLGDILRSRRSRRGATCCLFSRTIASRDATARAKAPASPATGSSARR